jgi:hypothetical protein
MVFIERGFDAAYADLRKIVLLEANFSKNYSGSDAAVYTHIAHIAWQQLDCRP